MLGKVRMARGVSQQELAEAMGISLATLRRIERNQAENPGYRYLVNAAMVLGVEVGALIEPEWREWKVFDHQHPEPPQPEDFWRRPHAPGQAYLDELVRRGVLS